MTRPIPATAARKVALAAPRPRRRPRTARPPSPAATRHSACPACIAHASWTTANGSVEDEGVSTGIVPDPNGRQYFLCIGDGACLNGGFIDIEFSVPSIAVGHYDDQDGVFAQFYEPGVLEHNLQDDTNFEVDIDGNDGTYVWGRFSGKICELAITDCGLTSVFKDGRFSAMISTGTFSGGAPQH